MRDRIRFWMKLTLILAMAFAVYSATPAAQTGNIGLELKALLIHHFGEPAQAEALGEEFSRRAAAEGGYLKVYEAHRAFREAVDAQRRLARIDSRLADYSIRIAARDRDEQQAEAAEYYPQFAGVLPDRE
jgi:hypothetical protein